MKKSHSLLQRSALIAGMSAAAMLLSPVALAANTAQTQYQVDVQHCKSTPGIDQKACMREAGAALEASRRNTLTTPTATAENLDRTQRCSVLPADQRQDCLTLMEGTNTQVQGSVQSGGILRETTITVPAGSNS